MQIRSNLNRDLYRFFKVLQDSNQENIQRTNQTRKTHQNPPEAPDTKEPKPIKKGDIPTGNPGVGLIIDIKL